MLLLIYLLRITFVTTFDLALVQNLPILSPGIYPTFSDYIQLFYKNYSQSQKQARYTLYSQRLKTIAQHNNNPEKEYTQTVNNFTDWTDSELQRFRNYRPDMQGQKEGQKATQQLRRKRRKRNLRSLYATNLDWSGLGAVTPIQNQGTCGSCWAFAAIATAQSFAIINKNANLLLGLSQQFPLVCTPANSCSGGYSQNAAAQIVKRGCPYRSAYPYTPSSTSKTICTKASSYFKVSIGYTYYQSLTDDEIISLLQTSPVSADVYAGSSWSYYSSGILSCNSQAIYPTHVVELIGYTSTYWIVKNQWGSSWGQRGFAWVTRSRANQYINCLIGSGIMQYWGNPNTAFQSTLVIGMIMIIVLLF